MKKCIALVAVLVLAASITGCSDGAKKNDEVASNLDIVPLLIDRQILTDAVWGEGTDIPENVACIAGSQFKFVDVVNPITIAENNTEDAIVVMPTIITSSVNIYMMTDDADLRAEVCPAGDLYFILAASPETAIDIEVAGDTCPNLSDIDTPEGAAFPQVGTAVAHFESHEIEVSITDLTKEEAPAEGPTEETTEETTEEATDEETAEEEPTDPNTVMKKVFKLVIDECKVPETTVE